MREKDYEDFLVTLMQSSKHRFGEIEGKTYLTLIGEDDFDKESFQVFNLEKIKKLYEQNKRTIFPGRLSKSVSK